MNKVENSRIKITVLRRDNRKSSGIEPLSKKEKIKYTDREYLMERGKLLFDFFTACSLREREK